MENHTSNDQYTQILSLINRRERQILVHSYIYYELNQNLIPDFLWTKWAFELAELRDQHLDIFAESVYAWAFVDFNGSTGYDLYSAYTRPEIMSRAIYLVNISKGKTA